MNETNKQMPLEIWTDINGHATRTQFNGGVRYIRAAEYDALREQNRVLRCAIEEYAKAKTDFDDKRLQEDHHAWRERYTRLVGAETILIALTATSQEVL